VLSGLLAIATVYDKTPDGALVLGFVVAAAGVAGTVVAEVASALRVRTATVWLHLALGANLVVVVWWLLIFGNILETT
jgi:hypothetical protein